MHCFKKKTENHFVNIYKKTRAAFASHRRLLFGALISLVFVGLHGGLVFSREVTMEYADKSCVNQAHVFPGLHRQTGQERYQAELVGGLKVGNFRLVSSQVCVTPQSAPTEVVVRLRIAPFGGMLFAKTYRISAGKPPVPDTARLSRHIPIDQQLDIPLSFEDRIFNYELHAAKKIANCAPEAKAVCQAPNILNTPLG